jgi:hypothetical protein
MAETLTIQTTSESLTINTPTITEVVSVVQAGPQGPQGPAGSADLSSPPPIGDVVPNSGAFTTISASGLAIFPHIHGSLAGDIYVHVKNTEGTALSRGTPVYVKGNVGATDRVEVGAADFDDAAKMPAIGLLDQDLLNNGMGDAVILGELPAANTAAYALNQELFVGNAGTLTGTRPTSGIVQSVGIVSRVQSNTGVIVVNMQGTRSPNEAFASSTDPRLTDSRTPTEHASSHHTGGSDAIAPNAIGAESLFTSSSITVSGSPTTLSASRAQIVTITCFSATTVNLPTTGNQYGDRLVVRGGSPVLATITLSATAVSDTITAQGQQRSYVWQSTGIGDRWVLNSVDVHVHGAADITSGTFNIARIPTGTASTQVSLGNHVHGGISNVGAIGTISGLPIRTGTNGVLEAGAFGTAAGQFAEGNHTHTASNITSGTLNFNRVMTQVFIESSGAPSVLNLTSNIVGGNLHALVIILAAVPEAFTEVVLPDLGADALGVVTVRPNYFEDPSANFVKVTNGTSNIWPASSYVEMDENEEVTFLWNNGRWDMDLRPNPLATVVSHQIFKPNDSGTLALTSQISKTCAVFTATDNQPPATSFATLDTRNSIAILDFDDASTESAVFVGVVPEATNLSGALAGFVTSLRWMATTAVSGNVLWSVQFERGNTDLDSDSFSATNQSIVATALTSGFLTTTNIVCSDFDALEAGDVFRVRVQRLGGSASDTMTGDAELVAVEIRNRQ